MRDEEVTVFSWLTGRRPKAMAGVGPEMTTMEAIEAVVKLGALMEKYPNAILDTKRLPLPKADMKTALKIAWGVPHEKLRIAVELGYVQLCQFQDGVGDAPIDPALPTGATPEQASALLRPYIERCERMKTENEALLAELREFKASTKPT